MLNALFFVRVASISVLVMAEWLHIEMLAKMLYDWVVMCVCVLRMTATVGVLSVLATVTSEGKDDLKKPLFYSQCAFSFFFKKF